MALIRKSKKVNCACGDCSSVFFINNSIYARIIVIFHETRWTDARLSAWSASVHGGTPLETFENVLLIHQLVQCELLCLRMRFSASALSNQPLRESRSPKGSKPRPTSYSENNVLKLEVSLSMLIINLRWDLLCCKWYHLSNPHVLLYCPSLQNQFNVS